MVLRRQKVKCEKIGIEFCVFQVMYHQLCTYQCQAGGWGVGGGAYGGDLTFFQKIAVKFPTTRKKCEVKYNRNPPPREMICGYGHEQKFKYRYPRDSKIFQLPSPRAKAIDQIPALCLTFPSPPPPTGWTLICA